MVRAAKDWRWSSYRAMTGSVPCPDWLDREWVLSCFSRRQKQAIEAFKKFVADGKNQPAPWEDLRNQIFLGDEQFVDRMLSLVDAEKSLNEMPKAQRRVMGTSLEEYVRTSGSRNSAIVRAYGSGDFTLAEIGEFFNLHYSTVGGIVKKFGEDR